MKSLAELSATDLKEHVVWRYHAGPSGDAGAQVEPDDRNSLAEYDEDVFIAATRFVLADGSEWSGYCSPQDSSGLDYLLPVVLTELGPNPLWFDVAPSRDAESEWWRRFGRNRNAVFPIAWECLVPVDGAVVKGVVDWVDGFSLEAASPPLRPASDEAT
jgi:hypothetical protein